MAKKYSKPINKREANIRKDLRKKIISINNKIKRRDIKERVYSVIQLGVNDSKYEVSRSTKTFKDLYTKGYGVYRYDKLKGRKVYKKQVFGKEAVREYLRVKTKSIAPDYRLRTYAKNFISAMRQVGISEKYVKQVRELFSKIKSDDELTYLLNKTEFPDISYAYAGEYSEDNRGEEIVRKMTNRITSNNNFSGWKKHYTASIKKETSSIKQIQKDNGFHIETRGPRQVKVYNKPKEERNW